MKTFELPIFLAAKVAQNAKKDSNKTTGFCFSGDDEICTDAHNDT